MSKATTTLSLIRYSFFPATGPSPGRHDRSPAVELTAADLPYYPAIAQDLLRDHDSIELALPHVFPIAGFFVAIRMKRSGFTFRIISRQGRLVIIAAR